MGTRGLICVVQGGEFRVAQYTQFDCYPTGQGQGVVEFLLREGAVKALKQAASRVRRLSDAEVQAIWKANGESLPDHLSRRAGSDVLDYVVSAESPDVHLATSFAADSLFCEWAYVVDLDSDRLEVYRGFNKQPLKPGERFYGYERFCDEDTRADGYMPVRLKASYAFSELKVDTMESLEWGGSDAD